MNQKAKVTFFFFIIFDRNQPMTQPSAGKKGVSYGLIEKPIPGISVQGTIYIWHSALRTQKIRVIPFLAMLIFFESCHLFVTREYRR